MTRKSTLDETVDLVHRYGVTGAARVAGVNERTMRRRRCRALIESPGCMVQDARGAWRRAGEETATLALLGEVGGPPIPDIAKPPAGFVVTRNSGQYDADGKLRKQWVGTRRDAGGEYVAPAGHAIKGESALVDHEGRLLARWIKTREGSAESLAEALATTFAAYEGAGPMPPVPVEADDDLLTVYPLPDLHFGMLAWGKETGTNYDIKHATAVALDSVRALVAQSRPSRRAVILGLGDYFHANDEKAATPGAGHKLDVDARWSKVFHAGAHLATALVELVATKHQEVEVVFLPGNHDPDAAICLTVALGLFYSKSDRIKVHQSPGVAWFLRFGRVLLGATHGHTMRPDRMAMMLATDRAEDWGQTHHRAFFYGHIHHESAREVGPVRVESFGAPAGRDAWNAAGGYRAGRALSALTYHYTDGEIGRHRINILST